MFKDNSLAMKINYIGNKGITLIEFIKLTIF